MVLFYCFYCLINYCRCIFQHGRNRLGSILVFKLLKYSMSDHGGSHCWFLALVLFYMATLTISMQIPFTACLRKVKLVRELVISTSQKLLKTSLVMQLSWRMICQGCLVFSLLIFFPFY